MTKKIGLIVGSLRENSFNRMIANTIPELVDNADYEHISLGELPLYNADLDRGNELESVQLYRNYWCYSRI
ncbi:NADPH-dependent FMN reductase [Paenibacillus sp. L3-i20]|uniref:NADPH-dependent FMN reductase n=1 Tax=Paenibacillus sp. L3-i20 TaxID=2905833 RepID=UPI00207E14AA|nr:hypothetical protein L3i20_v245030 [Paenibacillus sp. L3-i20]